MGSFLMYLEGTLYMWIILPRKDNKFTPIIGLRSFPFWRSMHRNFPLPMTCDLPTFKFMVTFTWCFMVSKVHMCIGTFPKWRARMHYHLVLNPLFWECPHLSVLLSTLGEVISILFPNDMQKKLRCKLLKMG
jgi:hypothetical protein